MIEVKCTQTWPEIRQEMDRLHRGVFDTRSGRLVQSTELTAHSHESFRLMGIAPPPRLEKIEAVLARRSKPGFWGETTGTA